MAWATKCDRCGKFFDYHSNEANALAFLIYDRGKDKYEIEGDECDLCPHCIESLENWLARED